MAHCTAAALLPSALSCRPVAWARHLAHAVRSAEREGACAASIMMSRLAMYAFPPSRVRPANSTATTLAACTIHGMSVKPYAILRSFTKQDTTAQAHLRQ